jgi:hypothetical protein
LVDVKSVRPQELHILFVRYPLKSLAEVLGDQDLRVINSNRPHRRWIALHIGEAVVARLLVLGNSAQRDFERCFVISEETNEPYLIL